MPQPTENIPLDLEPKRIDAIHRSLLAGLLSNVATRGEGNDYLLPRGGKANLFPGSSLFKRKPAWIMAAEIVETSRTYARTIAPIQPIWIERAAAHLVKRAYSESTWQRIGGHVVAFEKVSLHGLVIVERRSVHYGPIDPLVSRQLFIHHALVLRDWRCSGEFFKHNAQLIAEIQRLEAKRRMRDLLVDEEQVAAFYDRRVPHEVFNGPLFEKWRFEAEKARPTLLFMHRRDLLKRDIEENPSDYPDELRIGGITIPLDYIFNPSDPDDGITATLPLMALNQLPAGRFEWLVPGLLREKVIALMKSMSKTLRVKFVPVPEHADRALAMLRPDEPSLHDELARALGKMIGEPIDRDAFSAQDLPPYLRMNFRVVNEVGEAIMMGRDLEQIRRALGVEARNMFRQQPPSEFNRDGITSWDFADLPDHVEVRRNGMTLLGYPTLVDAGSSVSLRLSDTAELAKTETRGGVRRLLALQLREEVKWLTRKLPGLEPMSLIYASIGNADDFKNDLADAVVDRALFDPYIDLRTRAEFLERAERAWKRLSPAANEITQLVGSILEAYQAVRMQLSEAAAPALVASYQDMRRQLAKLIYPGFVAKTPPAWLAHYPRYLAAMQSRLRKLHAAGLARDEAGMNEIMPFERLYAEHITRRDRDRPMDAELETFRWMMEEFRVSLFAQELKTALPVSVKRIEAQWMKAVKAGR